MLKNFDRKHDAETLKTLKIDDLERDHEKSSQQLITRIEDKASKQVLELFTIRGDTLAMLAMNEGSKWKGYSYLQIFNFKIIMKETEMKIQTERIPMQATQIV